MNKEAIRLAVKDLLLALGENPDREGLIDTPKRIANMYSEILEEKEEINYTTFEVDSTDTSLLVVKDIEFSSICEHHLLPFVGTVSIGYIPKGRVLGLSKFARVVDKFSRSLQLQERMMMDIVSELKTVLDTEDIAIYVNSKHYCMISRGVKQHNSSTITTYYSGQFKETLNRQEFLSHVKS